MSERGLVAAWYRGAGWLWLLRPLELLFRAATALRRQFYRSGLLSSYRAPVPVVVVGNITVGGTGKTPVVIALVEALQARGLRPGVVSRGYGAADGEFPRRVDAGSDPRLCGDEPLLIARRTGVPVVIDPDRPAAVRALLLSAPVDIVVCDDGLQHYALQRDLEIVLIDRQRGLGNGFCLPAGPLREPRSRLRSVDHVLYRGSDSPRDGVSYQSRDWVNIRSAERRPLTAFSGVGEVDAVAGIGQPAQFFASLEALGIAFRPHPFPDHHQFGAGDFSGMAGHTILMTEKDAVKCSALAGDDAWYLCIDASLPDDLVAAAAALAVNTS
ncbi:tetraacyldisaccharide 4'-kinase [Haliea sp. E17]|uniref:tetraacyldisaccharide 4'-kinase n=1 Tax=Haliea sp. E17 TaxID=3401576 RepID=UPI003AACB266